MWWECPDRGCVDVPTAVFFPESGDVRRARAVCAGCTVRAECLDYALHASGEYPLLGIWGGTTADERRRMRPGYRPPRDRDLDDLESLLSGALARLDRLYAA